MRQLLTDSFLHIKKGNAGKITKVMLKWKQDPKAHEDTFQADRISL